MREVLKRLLETEAEQRMSEYLSNGMSGLLGTNVWTIAMAFVSGTT